MGRGFLYVWTDQMKHLFADIRSGITLNLAAAGALSLGLLILGIAGNLR